jgi:hypothetical protein
MKQFLDSINVSGTCFATTFTGAGTGLTGTAPSLSVYNASLLGGFGFSQTGGANSIVQRDVNGYIQNSYFYSSGGGAERNSTGLSYVAGFNASDYYFRSYGPAAVASMISGQTMNINGSSTSCTGNAATVTTLTPAQIISAINGQSNSDWYRTSGSTGWYNSTYATGIYSTGAGLVQTYNGSSFQANGNVTATGQFNGSGAGLTSIPNSALTTNLNHIGTLANANGVLTNNGSGTFTYSTPLVNPMTTAGDVIVGGTAGAANRLGIGSTGQALTVVSGNPAWATITSTLLTGLTTGSNTSITSAMSLLTALQDLQAQINAINTQINNGTLATEAWVTAHFSGLGGGSCFIAGSLVLMADYTWKAIEKIVAGNYVLGIDLQPNLVLELKEPLLENRFLVNFEDGNLITSAEHTIWSRKDGVEWFSSRDTKELAEEALVGTGADLLIPPFNNDAWEPMEYAHLSGFKKHKTILIEASPMTQLYQVICDRSKTYIVNGYVVGSVPDDRTFNYGGIEWEKIIEEAISCC